MGISNISKFFFGVGAIWAIPTTTAIVKGDKTKSQRLEKLGIWGNRDVSELNNLFRTN
ncbi:hypothetical protein [Mycoplasma parvum]|uniref:Uncharacterized protein n=1 Tax=Mycoplasma parvum str. Indiana TaxID=1403316 RepID=U5NFK2_9MOLU|nr:hypothetical protein [Mycoplasma parvum]AGX88929.1 hypothetical protein PRV_00820 [Mycoplasma parvum str. Indiana]